MAQAGTAPMTAEDLFDRRDDGYRYELCEGELVRMTPTGGRHSAVAGRTARLIDEFAEARDLGICYGARLHPRAVSGHRPRPRRVPRRQGSHTGDRDSNHLLAVRAGSRRGGHFAFGSPCRCPRQDRRVLRHRSASGVGGRARSGTRWAATTFCRAFGARCGGCFPDLRQTLVQASRLKSSALGG